MHGTLHRRLFVLTLFLALISLAAPLRAADEGARAAEPEPIRLTPLGPDPRLQERVKPLASAAPDAPGADDKYVAVRDIAPPVIAGIASFVEDRVEAELRAWATDTIVRSLCRPTGAQAYFVETCGLTGEDGEYRDIYTMPGASHLLVAALREDGRNLPQRIIEQSGASAQQVQLARVLVAVADQLRRGRSPLTVLAGLHRNAEVRALCFTALPSADDAGCRLMLASIVVHAYQSVGPEARELESAVALIAEELRTEAMATAGGVRFIALVDNLTGEAQQLAAEVRAVRDGLLADLANATTAIQDGVERVKEAREARDRQAEVEEIVALVLEVRDLLVVASAYTEGPPADLEPLKEEWVTAIAQLSLGDYQDAMYTIAKAVDCGDLAKRRICAVLPLAMTIAGAEDQAEVRSVLDAYASPLGSWRGRQDQPMTSIAAWPALAYERSSWQPGITAATGTVIVPVGFSRSWPVDRTRDARHGNAPTVLGKVFGSHAVLVSVIDVGYLLRAEESRNTVTGQLDEERYDSFSDYLSIGLYYRASLRNSPLSVGVGYSYSPNQRQETSAGVTREADTKRWVVFLGMEITLFPL